MKRILHTTALVLWLLVGISMCSFPTKNRNPINYLEILAFSEPANIELKEPYVVMINKTQLRETVREVLMYLDEATKIKYSVEAEDLLIMTAAHESKAGTWLKQKNGPALGIFQMEPNTERDIHDNFLKYKPTIRNAVEEVMFDESFSGLTNLQYNVAYQIIMARIHFFRDSKPLPKAATNKYLTKLASYAKRVYNTHKGKATATKYLEDYKRYGV